MFLLPFLVNKASSWLPNSMSFTSSETRKEFTLKFTWMILFLFSSSGALLQSYTVDSSSSLKVKQHLQWLEWYWMICTLSEQAPPRQHRISDPSQNNCKKIFFLKPLLITLQEKDHWLFSPQRVNLLKIFKIQINLGWTTWKIYGKYLKMPTIFLSRGTCNISLS